jgi:hypothetical protein
MSVVRPSSKASAFIPSWLPWVAGAIVIGDGASGLLDPNMPALIAAGLAAAGSSAVGGNRLLLPRLKQLPESWVCPDFGIELTRACCVQASLACGICRMCI